MKNRFKKVRVGLIGCGAGHANSSHLPQLCKINEVSLEALCDLDEKKLRQAMERYHVKKGYTDFRQMLAEIELDAVFVIIRPSRLKDVVIPCFEKGLAVSVEKSPGLNSTETGLMLNAADKNHCFNMVGFNRRFSPVVTEAKKALGKGNALHRIAGRFYRKYTEPISAEHAGIHGVDMMRCLGGEVKNVRAFFHKRKDGAIDTIQVFLQYENGSSGLFVEMNYCAKTEEIYEIHGDGISAFIDYQNGTLQFYKGEEEKPTVINDRQIVGSKDKIKISSSYWETKHFIDSLAADRNPSPDLADSLKTMRLNEMIFNQSQL